MTTDLGFKCAGAYAGAEIDVSVSSAGSFTGYGTDTLFRANGSTWVDIGRPVALCKIVPAVVHVYCTVS